MICGMYVCCISMYLSSEKNKLLLRLCTMKLGAGYELSVEALDPCFSLKLTGCKPNQSIFQND